MKTITNICIRIYHILGIEKAYIVINCLRHISKCKLSPNLTNEKCLIHQSVFSFKRVTLINQCYKDYEVFFVLGKLYERLWTWDVPIGKLFTHLTNTLVL